MRVVFLSTSVGAIGSGIGGGVELTLRTLADQLKRRGHDVTVVAPRGSTLPGHHVVQVEGALHVPSQTLDRSAPLTTPRDSVLVNMWNRACNLVHEEGSDVVLNFAYDALPFNASAQCDAPVAHLVSMGSLSDEMDHAVLVALAADRRTIAMHSRAQAATFGPEVERSVTVVASGIDLSAYTFVANSSDDLAFVGRISPEKGIADVFRVSELSGRRIMAFGVMEDRGAWNDAVARHPSARVEHQGFLSTSDLQARLGTCAAMIMVHRWVEAFGNVAIEALACGVPVITYDRGGPAEIVRDGVTGFVVRADDPSAVALAVRRLDEIDRQNCRADAEQRYSAEAFAARVEAWLSTLAGA